MSSNTAAAVKGSGEHGRKEGSRGSHSDGHGCGLKGGESSKDQSKHQGSRVKGHESHQRKSRSHSGSSSPPGAMGRSHDRNQPHRLMSGRSHGSHSHGVDRPSKSSTLMTPGHPGTVLSQTLSTIIDHTSILLEQQQKLLAMETTPTSMLTTPSISSVVPGTPPTHHTQPLAKKKLSLTPQHGLSPSYSANQSLFSAVPQPVVVCSAAQGGVAASPQAVVDNSGLHPLQRALLLQNQKIQELPHPYLFGGVEPSLQTPPTAIPHHMPPHQSYPGSPLIQSPVAAAAISLGPGTPVYSVPMVQPLTPLQPNMFVMPQGTPPTYDPSIPPPQPHVLSSKVLQRPVSKLAYLNNNTELLRFPTAGGLERVGPSQLKPEQVDRGLAALWLQHYEMLSRQVEQGRLGTHKRRTVEKFFLSGQLTKRQVALAAKDVRITSTSQRVRHLQALVQELDKR